MLLLLLLILFLWIILSSFTKKNTILKNEYISGFLIVFITLFLTISIEADVSLGTDMARYLRAFSTMGHMTFTETIQYFSMEPLFLFLQWILSKISTNPDLYVKFITFFSIFILVLTSRNLFSDHNSIFFIFSYLSFPFFYSYLYNGTRQGLSMLVLLLAISLWLNSKKSFRKQKIFILLIVACLFHYSAIPIAILYFIVINTNISLKKYIIAWISFVLLFITDLNTIIMNIPIISNIDFVQAYSSYELINAFGEGNKTNFLVFSMFFLILAIYFVHKYDLDQVKQVNYVYIIKFYIAFNIFYLLFGFVAYSNRISAYSWYLIPLLIMYPVIHNRNYSSIRLGFYTILFCVVGFITSSYQYFILY